MDLNQLLYHHQIALIAVSRARHDGHLLSNFDLPRYYSKRIAEYRDRRGLTDGPPTETRLGSARPTADPATSEPVAGHEDFLGDRSEERSVGKECVSTCTYRGGKAH